MMKALADLGGEAVSSIRALSGVPTQVAPGWYPDPTGARQARWWDGEEWTHHVQALPIGKPPEEAWVAESRLVPPGSSWANRSLAWGIVAIFGAVGIVMLGGWIAMLRAIVHSGFSCPSWPPQCVAYPW